MQAPPPELNWDMWLGPAPYAEYFPERCHKSYRYFLDYSGGVFADFWCHIADIAWWSVHPKGLKSITARGGKTDGVADAPKWLDADFEFENVKLFWTTEPPNVPGAAERNIGAHFEGDITAHTNHVLDEVQKELEKNGSSMEHVLKVNVYLADLNDYKKMNEAYRGRFGKKPPVRTTIAAYGGIPGNSLVEIDCIAMVKK